MLLAVIFHSHPPHISIKQASFSLTASLTQHKVIVSPQRLHFETRSFTLGGKSVKEEDKFQELSLTGIHQMENQWGSSLPLRLPELLWFTKSYQFPREAPLKRNFTILNSFLSYSLISPNYPLSYLNLQEDFCIHKVSGNKAYKHSHTNKLELTRAYNCVLVGAFPALSLVLC